MVCGYGYGYGGYGYNNGYWAGYWNGYNNGYYNGMANNNYYYNSHDGSGTYYGPRGKGPSTHANGHAMSPLGIKYESASAAGTLPMASHSELSSPRPNVSNINSVGSSGVLSGNNSVNSNPKQPYQLQMEMRIRLQIQTRSNLSKFEAIQGPMTIGNNPNSLPSHENSAPVRGGVKDDYYSPNGNNLPAPKNYNTPGENTHHDL